MNKEDEDLFIKNFQKLNNQPNNRYCEDDESKLLNTYKTTDQLLKELETEIKITKQKKYIQLTNTEEVIYHKSKLLIENRKPVKEEVILAFIINSIRKGEPDKYIESIAQDYQQNLELIRKQTDKKYLCKKNNNTE